MAIATQHPLFLKYRRGYLHELTGYTKSYLCRVANEKVPLSRSFIERVCFKLNRTKEELFLPRTKCALPCGCSGSRLGMWLEEKCREEHLSLRQAATKTGLSHCTIADIIAGGHPSPESIRKLTKTFGGDSNQRLALEDKLLVLAGLRTERLKGGDISEPIARILDKLGKFSEPELKMMESFADFLKAERTI